MNPLINDYELAVVDLSKDIDNINMDFNKFLVRVEASLVNASASKYNIIALYDTDMQKEEPIVYSVTGMLHNIKTQIIDKLSSYYAIETVYFITLDDMVRDQNGQVLNDKLKKSIEFDKKGYIDETDVSHFVSLKDIEFIKKNYFAMLKTYSQNDGRVIIDDFISEFKGTVLDKVKNRIVRALNNEIPINDVWYEKAIKEAFVGYAKELESAFARVNNNEISVNDIGFTIEDYLKDNIASYSNIQQDKVFRLNMLDKTGHSRRDETKYKNYYKIIAMVIYLVKEDKKYLFDAAYMRRENHYFADVDIEETTLANMISDYRNNILYEQKVLGEIKFSNIQVEEFDKNELDSPIYDEKKYVNPYPKFSLLENNNNLEETKNFADNEKQRYIDRVKHCNTRLRKIADSLRINFLRDFNGRTRAVTMNELLQIREEAEEKIKALKNKIAQNTPKDIIQMDYAIFDESERKVLKANDILKKRISIFHMSLNAAVVLFCTVIIFALFRRFDSGIVTWFYKFVLLLSPTIAYILTHLFICFLNIRKANGIMVEIRKYIEKKISEINIDDKKFKIYINNIYELMLQTKYYDKIQKGIATSQDDFDNFTYHKQHLDEALDDIVRASKLMKLNFVENRELVNIKLKIDTYVNDNPLYCPLLYVGKNEENYIIKNSSHKENLNHELLNFVDSISIRNDEVYND